ncbi:MAG: hypothetical protein JSS16_10015 [Proteobacteria bacterium]|nr:hypothetical protein [Pseudomonadota bacterium]
MPVHRSYLAAALIAYLLLALSCTTVAAAAPWSLAASMSVARADHTVTRLASGKVLVVGGFDAGSVTLASAELYDPISNTWSAAGSLTKPRHNHTATLLASGKVLVAGGFGGGGPLASAELYDPASNTWSAAGTLLTARYIHTATLLPSGKVLVVGGDGVGPAALAAVELYDPATNSWTAASPLNSARTRHTATLLGNGNVLIAGGNVLGSPANSAHLYAPATNSWSAAANLPTAVQFHTASLLPSGKVLVAGGQNGGAVNATQLYDPDVDVWTVQAPLNTPRFYHTATVLATGEVLVVGGFSTSFLASAEVFYPALNAWAGMGSLSESRSGPTMSTRLLSGKVLVAGGSSAGSAVRASAELFDGGPPAPAAHLSVSGNGYNIAPGATVASTLDGTDFGSVAAGVPVTRTFTLFNAPSSVGPGSMTAPSENAHKPSAIGDVTIASIASSNGAFISSGGLGTLASGASRTFTTTFNASAPGVYNTTITIASDDPATPNYTFALRATVTGGSTPSTVSAPMLGNGMLVLLAVLFVVCGVVMRGCK